MRRLGILLTLASAVVPVAALGQDTRGAELAQADRQLNTTFRALIRQLSESDQAALRVAQRAWIQFRDADCAFGWAEQRECLTDRTDAREKQIRETVYFDANGHEIVFAK